MGINATRNSSAKKAPASTPPKTVRKRTGVARAVYDLSVKARHEKWINSDNTLRKWRKHIQVCIQQLTVSTDDYPRVVDAFLSWCDRFNCTDQGVDLIIAVVGNRLNGALAAYATTLTMNPYHFAGYMLVLLSRGVQLSAFKPYVLLAFIDTIDFGLPGHEKIRTQVVEFFLTESDHHLEYADLELLLSCSNTEAHREKILSELVAYELAGKSDDER